MGAEGEANADFTLGVSNGQVGDPDFLTPGGCLCERKTVCRESSLALRVNEATAGMTRIVSVSSWKRAIFAGKPINDDGLRAWGGARWSEGISLPRKAGKRKRIRI